MYILMDYDNIERAVREKGLRYTIERIASQLCEHTSELPERLVFRLYGGWYDQTAMTRYAQKLSREIEGEFPCIFHPLANAKTTVPLRLQAELARALLVDPTNNLLHTFRERSNPSKSLRVAAPQSVGCTRPDCGLRHLKDLFRKGKCPEAGCQITISDLVVKNEQKLVDVMLASDLHHLIESKPDDLVAVVTSDEDLWPAVCQALLKARCIIHVQARSDRRTPSYYRRSVSSTYIECSI